MPNSQIFCLSHLVECVFTGGPNPRRGFKSTSESGPKGAISASGFGPGVQFRGGINPLGHWI